MSYPDVIAERGWANLNALQNSRKVQQTKVTQLGGKLQQEEKTEMPLAD